MAGASSGQSTQSTTQSANQATSGNISASYIPDYSQTPILEEIARYSRQMAPQVYQWGMDQYTRNQGNIDALMRSALSYASPQRISSDVGMAEAGVQQATEAGRLSAIRDLESYGIDPSSGRYAALEHASRVKGAAAAAGAGNQQRMSDIALSNTMQNQAISAGLQNTALGYSASTGMNQLLGTAAQLKYSPLGQTSSGYSQSTGSSSGQSTSEPKDAPFGTFPGGESGGGYRQSTFNQAAGFALGGPVDDAATSGGFVSSQLSPSNGGQTDDVEANLNAGEFVIPKDVAAWKGQEFFYKLMAQTRRMRAEAGNKNGSGNGSGRAQQTGYFVGGPVQTGEDDDRRPFTEDAVLRPNEGEQLPQASPVLFGGEHAQTADKPALALAKSMLRQGFKPEDIGSHTGWDTGADSKWRFEIPDNEARINEGAIPKTAARPGRPPLSGPTVPLRDVLVHPQLQAAYPEWFNAVRVGRESQPQSYGFYDPDYRTLTLNEKPRGAPREDLRGLAVHELQHGLQAEEDFQPGGEPGLFRQRGKLTPYEQYHRLKGEVEARNAAARLDLSPEERKATPWRRTMDVPLAAQTRHPYYVHGTEGYVGK